MRNQFIGSYQKLEVSEQASMRISLYANILHPGLRSETLGHPSLRIRWAIRSHFFLVRIRATGRVASRSSFAESAVLRSPL